MTTLDKAFQSKTAGEKLSTGVLPYTVDTQTEWKQIFNDTWRWYRDFFYDRECTAATGRRWASAYRAYLPYSLLARRSQLGAAADGG